jgi:Putative Actinobacterial Holin-X, holin superfamily III
MLAPSGDLLRAGLGLKINQVKRATQSYLRDRTHHATGTVTSYAVAAGLFAASGVFLIAAIFVGLIALFRWVEIKYGMFWGFGAVGGLLLLIAIVCAAVAASRLKRKPPHFPTLSSRLRVAVTANPLKADPTDAMQARAAALMPAASAGNRSGSGRVKPLSAPLNENRPVQAGLILAATLLGWVAVRRKNQKRQMGA